MAGRRAPARRRAPRRPAPRRKRPTRLVVIVGLLLAAAFAAAAIAGLFQVARTPEPGPFRFPTPAPGRTASGGDASS